MEDNKGKILIYQNEKGDTKIDVFFQDNDIWLTQAALAKLYQTTPQNITLHIKNIYSDEELLPEATCKEYLQVQIEGGRQIRRSQKNYNFQMVLAIGYRVRSRIGMHFRRWASHVLTEYTKKGFAINDERLKNPQLFGVDYFDELLERIRDIRSSEARLYDKIKNIYATSVDYDKDSDHATLFFKTVQNKLHYSVHGHTASELIAERADATKDNMGLTSFKGAVVRKGDVDIAKNYLNEDEITALNRIVNMYLDYAEDQALQHIPMYMSDWENKLNNFLQFTGRKVLQDAGSISAEFAKEKANREYELYDIKRKEADREIDDLLNSAKRLGKDKGDVK